MKNYICLNHGECQWADETPPREFPLVDGELYCPNCESTNIREAIPEQNKLKRFLPFIAGAILLLGLIYAFWPNNVKQKEVDKIESTDEETTVVDGKPGTGSDNGDSRENKRDDTVRPPVKQNKTPITWTLLENSGFCDPALDGTYFYSERNNLGQIRERKVLNKAGCYPASN